MNTSNDIDVVRLVQLAGQKIAHMSGELTQNPMAGFVVKAAGPNAWDVEGAGLYEHEIVDGRGHHSFKADGVEVSYMVGRSGPDSIVISDGDEQTLAERAGIVDGVYARFTEAKKHALEVSGAGAYIAEPQF